MGGRKEKRILLRGIIGFRGNIYFDEVNLWDRINRISSVFYSQQFLKV